MADPEADPDSADRSIAFQRSKACFFESPSFRLVVFPLLLFTLMYQAFLEAQNRAAQYQPFSHLS